MLHDEESRVQRFSLKCKKRTYIISRRTADVIMIKVTTHWQCCQTDFSLSLTDEQVRVDLGEAEPPKKPRLEKQENRSSPITVQTSKDLLSNMNDNEETNADDFAMEMGLACVVCRYSLILKIFK